MILPWVIVVVVVVYVLLDVTIIQPWAIRRGRAVRAANGGRHTAWWWASLGLVVAIAVFLLVVHLLK